MGEFRQNPTDNEQSQIEDAAFKGGIAVFDDAKTKTISRGAPQAAAQRTANAGSDLGKNAGVVMPIADKPDIFESDTQGKPGPASPFFVVKNNTGVAFANVIGDSGITLAFGTDFDKLAPGDRVLVNGSADNDGTFTIFSILLSGAQVITVEAITPEIAGASVTITRV